MTDINERVRQFITIRDMLDAMDKKHELARKQYVEMREYLGAIITKFIESNNLKNVKTEHGTATVSTRYTASLADADAFMKFVVDNKLFDLLERRASSTAVRDYVEEHKNLPPGVNLSAIRTVGVRRASDKS